MLWNSGNSHAVDTARNFGSLWTRLTCPSRTTPVRRQGRRICVVHAILPRWGWYNSLVTVGRAPRLGHALRPVHCPHFPIIGLHCMGPSFSKIRPSRRLINTASEPISKTLTHVARLTVSRFKTLKINTYTIVILMHQHVLSSPLYRDLGANSLYITFIFLT